MTLGIIGLGKMGAGLAARLLRNGHHVVGFDLNAPARADLEADGGDGVDSLARLVETLGQEGPRVFWIMVPSGAPVDSVLDELEPHLQPGDIIVEGGNSYYKDSVRRAQAVPEGVHYLDVGVSGGVWGLDEGFCLMIGGADEAVEAVRPAFESLAPGKETGWKHVGPSGAGHFVKMVHNGMEYGLMQAYAEGFAIMKAKPDYDLDLAGIAGLWGHGSVVRSWLLELVERALQAEGRDLKAIAPYVSDSGMGRWTVQEAIDNDVPAPVITDALLARLRSRSDEAYFDRLLSALRNQFGGHAVKEVGSEK